MVKLSELEYVIGSYGMWKALLKRAIHSGRIDRPLSAVRADDQCALGKWLRGNSLSPREKESALYQTVQSLHREFHLIAARVAETTMGGRKSEAEEALSPRGCFSEISANLTDALVAWRNTLILQ